MLSQIENIGYFPRKVVTVENGEEVAIWRGWGWFIVPEWNINIAAPPKCGSSSLKRFFNMHGMNDVLMVKHCEVNRNIETFFVVRNPVDRFVSLWRSKCRDKKPILDNRVHGMSPHELADHIAKGNSDIHWTPQTKMLGGMNATLVPLERLNEWWASRGYGNIWQFNKTSGDVELDADIREWIEDYYAEDFILHSQARQSSNSQ